MAETDFWRRIRWFTPGDLATHRGGGTAGRVERDAMVNVNARITTPETDTSSHDVFAATRNVTVDDGELNAMIAQKREETPNSGR